MSNGGAPVELQLNGRYAISEVIASGGMATVYLGRLLGEVGFTRPVAIKRLHERFATDPEFVAMFVDEARVASRVRHPNVVPTLDVVAIAGELFLVMEYVVGASLGSILATLARAGGRVAPPIAAAIALGVLEGLHAAHEATREDGAPLGIVHRDVSPQNILVGEDGVARVLDFGVAKSADRLRTTEDGAVRGKFGYMAPEQLMNEPLDRRGDIWAVGVVLWEMLAGRRLYEADSPGGVVRAVLDSPPPEAPSSHPDLDAVVLTALQKSAECRFQTARTMALAIENALRPALQREVTEWVRTLATDELDARAHSVERMERSAGFRPEGTLRTKLAALGAPASAGATTSLGDEALPSDEATGRAPGRVSHRPTPALGVTAETEETSRARGPRRTLVAAVAAVAAVVLAGGTLVWSRAAVNGSPADTAASLEVATTSPEKAPETPTPLPVASATPSAVTSSSAAPSKPQTGPRGRSAPPPPRGNCNPPYTIGPPPDLIRLPKRECLTH